MPEINFHNSSLYQLNNVFYKQAFNIDDDILEIALKAEEECLDIFKKVDIVSEYNQLKVIKTMQDNKLSDSHFAGSTGYGYGDRGREVLEKVYADIFKAEDALVRQQIVSGTHAIALCLFGNLRPGDELLSVTGKPYDTLEEVIGIRENNEGSLKEFGISYKQVDFLHDGKVNYDDIRTSINEKTRMVLIQRSRGYSWRYALRIEDIKNIVAFIKDIRNDIIILVDNCYGEFVEQKEPLEIGADLIAGSLIKNPGGGLAPTGGYVAGKESYVRNAACRLTSPGIGKEVGATLEVNRLFFQGLFFAPHVVAESLKGAILLTLMM